MWYTHLQHLHAYSIKLLICQDELVGGPECAGLPTYLCTSGVCSTYHHAVYLMPTCIHVRTIVLSTYVIQRPPSELSFG